MDKDLGGDSKENDTWMELSRGYKTLIDPEYYEQLSKYKWHVQSCKSQLYAATIINRKTVYLHRLLFNNPTEHIVDHINHDTLDNRKHNLRLVSKQQNSFNSRPKNKLYPKGVCFDKQTGKYIAQIMINSKNYKLGRYTTPEEAANVYGAKAQELFGNYNYKGD
jgi:hypothetical protein